MQDEAPGPDRPGGDGPPDRYEEFLGLFAAEREKLYAYIFSMVPHHPDAEDVFQRCSILLWRKFPSYEKGASFLAWACGFARLEVCNFLRVAGRDRLRFDPELIDRLAEGRVDSLGRHDDRLGALRHCLERLDAPERELVRRVYAGDRSIKELAEMAGLATQTLYNQLSRARHKLFNCVSRALEPLG